MIRFILGYAGVWAALLAWAIAGGSLPADGASAMLAVKLLAVPLGAAWLTADVIDRWRPRQAFSARVRRPVFPFVAGGLGGALSALLAAAVLVLTNTGLVDVPSSLAPSDLDVIIIAGAGVVATASVVLCLARLRLGACVHCGYELAGSVGGRCPECGAVGSEHRADGALRKGRASPATPS